MFVSQTMGITVCAIVVSAIGMTTGCEIDKVTDDSALEFIRKSTQDRMRL